MDPDHRANGRVEGVILPVNRLLIGCRGGWNPIASSNRPVCVWNYWRRPKTINNLRRAHPESV